MWLWASPRAAISARTRSCIEARTVSYRSRCVASYVRFGRVFCASGPQAEGFPNAASITHGYATPPDRLFMTVGFNQPYPSMDKVDIAPNTVNSMVDTVLKAGWTGPPKNVLPGDMGPYNGSHIFAAVATFPYAQHAPGGHGIFCNNDPLSGWKAMCDYIFSNASSGGRVRPRGVGSPPGGGVAPRPRASLAGSTGTVAPCQRG